MRLTNKIRPLFVGAVLVLQPSVAALPAIGWEWNLFRSNDDYQVGNSKAPLAPGAPVAPTSPRWTDGGVQQAYAEGEPQSGDVQQTAHTGPSRSGTLLGKNSASSNRQQAPSWHGQKVRMPSKAFTRNTEAARPSMQMPFAKNQPPAANAAAARTHPGLPHPNSDVRRNSAPAQSTTPGARAVAAGRTPTNQPSAVPMRTAAQAQPTAPARSSTMPPATTRKPSPQPKLAATPEPTLAEPESRQATPAGIEPRTPGDRLIVQAHELSAGATTEDDYSQIVETCRRARASQLSPQLNDFANQLAGWSLNRRGQLKAESGRAREAMLDFDEAIRSNPRLWRALHNRGVLRAQEGQFEPAFDDFNLAIQFNPKFAKAYSNRAALFVVAGDLETALEDYSRAIELDPNLAVAHRGRARTCHTLGRLDEALDHFDAAVQLAPNDAHVIASRADLLTDLGRYADAAKGYDYAIKLDPKSVGALRSSAWLLATCPDRNVRNENLAIERAELAIELEGQEDAVDLDTLAAAQASSGDFTGAMQTIRQAIEIAPEADREVYQDRLLLYQRAKPYRIAPVRGVAQASYDQSY